MKEEEKKGEQQEGHGGPAHLCRRYVERLVWSEWRRTGALAERAGRRVAFCGECGRERPARRLRPPALREVRAEVPAAPPLADAAARAVAASLLSVGGDLDRGAGARGLFGDLARRGVAASLAEEWIDRFLRAGWLTARWRLGPPLRLVLVVLRTPEAMRELARPGEEARRREALAEARARTARLAHPKAADIATLLGGAEAEGLTPPLLRALSALAAHAESGETLAARVFSARHLGGSKELAGLRRRLEQLVGPLEEIGIREGAGLTLLGGQGALRLAGCRIDLADLVPFVGLSGQSLAGLVEIALPAGGLFVVENLAVFEACCRGEVEAAREALIAWSAGYPGRPLERLVQLAGGGGDPAGVGTALRIWADLDLDGVRIARLVASWSSAGGAFFRMSPTDLAAAPRRLPLSPRSAAAIRRDLAERPAAPLAETLRALLELGCWVEQETFLASGADAAIVGGGAERRFRADPGNE
jgi:hypothetical protein